MRTTEGTLSEDGAVVLRGAVDTERTSQQLVLVETLAGQEPIFAVTGTDVRFGVASRRLSGADALAASFLGHRPTCFGVSALRKAAGSTTSASWHQDLPAWRTRLAGGGDGALTVWVALTPAGVGSGGLRFVPGSHRGPSRALAADPDRSSLFGVRTPPGLVDEAAAQDLEVSPGDAVILHANVVHASWPNGGTVDQVAVALRYS